MRMGWGNEVAWLKSPDDAKSTPGLDATPLEILPGFRTHGVGGAENLQDPLLYEQQRQGLLQLWEMQSPLRKRR